MLARICMWQPGERKDVHSMPYGRKEIMSMISIRVDVERQRTIVITKRVGSRWYDRLESDEMGYFRFLTISMEA